VSGCKSLLVVLSSDKEAAYYHGHPALVARFFGNGVTCSDFDKGINVRRVRPSEVAWFNVSCH
jgi:hypothetical protein